MGSILNTNTNTNALKYLWRYITMQRQRVRFPLPKVCQYIYTLTTKIKSFNMPFFLWRPLINWTWFEIDRNIVLRYEYCIYCKCWFFIFEKLFPYSLKTAFLSFIRKLWLHGLNQLLTWHANIIRNSRFPGHSLDRNIVI
jgi:hypothetical protein